MKRLLLALAFLLSLRPIRVQTNTELSPSDVAVITGIVLLPPGSVALDQVVASRTRAEGDAAQVISRLLGQIQSLQAQVDLLLNSKDGSDALRERPYRADRHGEGRRLRFPQSSARCFAE